MITVGKVMYWQGDRVDILTKCKNRKEADCICKVWEFMPPPVLDFMYNKNLPRKKWDFYEWDLSQLQNRPLTEEEQSSSKASECDESEANKEKEESL